MVHPNTLDLDPEFCPNLDSDSGICYQYCDKYSVAEPEPPGAATFRAAPEPIFFLVGAGSRSRLF